MYLSVDYRYSWLATILRGLQTGFGEIDRLASEHEWFDGLWQCEYAEPIVGLACTSAQAYLVGVVSDVGKSQGLKAGSLECFIKKRKISFYSDDPSPLPSGQSRIVLINGTANYYKHHDEWSGWDPTNWIVKTFSEAGIDEHTEFPCLRVAELLFGTPDISNLDPLVAMVSSWRKHIVEKQLAAERHP